jgi:hypothetical protein
MAKALLGHVGGVDPRLIAEIRGLRERVHQLEAEVLRLEAENSALAASVDHNELLLTEKEPALA